MASTVAQGASSTRPDPANELCRVALERFADAGFAGTSLQQIADDAGYSKSSVLYHFASKEALLEAALAPALERLESVLAGMTELTKGPRERRAFVERFVDFLFEFRLQVHIFINQGQSLTEIPIVGRARETIANLARSLVRDDDDLDECVRFSVALGGAAYTLVAGIDFAELEPGDEELRASLVEVVSRLLEATARRAR